MIKKKPLRLPYCMTGGRRREPSRPAEDLDWVSCKSTPFGYFWGGTFADQGETESAIEEDSGEAHEKDSVLAEAMKDSWWWWMSDYMW